MNAGGSSPKERPRWLITLLGCRKHIGLVALWFLAVHIVMSAMLFNPVNYGKLFEKDKAGGLSARSRATCPYWRRLEEKFGCVCAPLRHCREMMETNARWPVRWLFFF